MLSQSRSHYQPGYLMSASQSNNSPTGAQRVDEAPVVQTKAKMDNAFSRGPASDFGMDSMFQSSRVLFPLRQRQTMSDEDVPPMNSLNDIPTELHADSSPSHFQPRVSRSFSRTQSSPMLYIIVFAYPSDKYSIGNCFKIGYRDPADAMRAVRKNGEILGGSWMVGVKWEDPAQAEALLKQPVSLPARLRGTSTPTVGTPIKLAPSASAFRRVAAGPPAPKPAPAPQAPSWASDAAPPTVAGAAPAGKGVLGQVSGMIFG
ncbi:hypothetical protein DFH09DRAFT_1247519 [Mycena vulgaris]|nr:hypothetical protein DFH09DRAFT_1247519 [Mycena vulgaris]